MKRRDPCLLILIDKLPQEYSPCTDIYKLIRDQNLNTVDYLNFVMKGPYLSQR